MKQKLLVVGLVVLLILACLLVGRPERKPSPQVVTPVELSICEPGFPSGWWAGQCWQGGWND